MRNSIILISLFLLTCKTSQLTQNEEKKPVLFTVAGEPIYTDEFVYVYNKNNVNNDSAFTKNDIEDYLRLYVNFKLKIREAHNRGMDTTKAFFDEFNTYKTQLKKPYLTESKVTEELVQEAYNRHKQEVNASHILIRLDENASPEDTLKAYNKILGIRIQAMDGYDFTYLAEKYSDDPSAKTNKGNLGYFTSFQMVYPFESAAYNTDIGKISSPVRTKFGYHIIKVNDKRPAQGSVTVSHIMVRLVDGDSAMARNKIFEIHEQATGGVNWDDLTRQFSDDVNTKNSGGRLRPFKVGQMPAAFQEAAFALNKPGDISDPVLTPYGWHIIRLEEKQPIESFEEMENSIRTRISRDSRADLSRKVLLSRLKTENKFVQDGKMLQNLWSFADSTLTNGQWTFPENSPMMEERIFRIRDQSYTAKMFFQYLKKEQKPNSYTPINYMQLMYKNYVDESVIAYEEEHLEEKYIDYRMLVKEYREGILLFQLMEEEVWSKAVADSTGLARFYETNKENYRWQERVDAVIYNTSDKDVLTEITGLIEDKKMDELAKNSLEQKYNAKTALTLQVEEGEFEKGDNQIIDQVNWEKGLRSISQGDRHYLININEVLPAGYKPLNEIKGLVISDYQTHLEKLWISELRNKYVVNINQEGLKYVYDTLEKK